MIDKTHSPRKIPYSIDSLEGLLSGALEHASHGWMAFEKETKVTRLNPDSWPPQVEAEVGSAQYHLSIVVTMLYEGFASLREEQERIESLMAQIDKYRSDNGL